MKTLRFALAAAFGVALLAGSASAYVLDTDGNGHFLRWNKSVVRYRMAAGNAPGGSAGENAVHTAFAAWSGASSQISYQFDGFSANGVQSYDNRNNVYWVYSGWSYDPSLLAITFRFYDTSNGNLLDADIVFNGQSYSWSIGGGGYDVQNSAAHEVGHFSGLGHSSHSEATMFASARPGETKKRDLHGDDVSGLSALYGGTGSPQGSGGVVSAPGVSGGGGGGCSIGGTTNARASFGDLAWTGFLLIGLALRRVRRRGESRCVAPDALSAFGGAFPRGSVPGAGARSAGLQYERCAGQALLGAGRHDRLLGPGL